MTVLIIVYKKYTWFSMKLIKKLLFSLLFIHGIQSLHAQQDPAYSFFMYNGISVNPAMAGSAGTWSTTLIHRKQWSGIQGAPQTQTLNMDGSVWNDKIGLGLSLVNDKIGVMNNLNVNGQYAYRVKMEKGVLSMGLQSGINNYKAPFSSIVTDAQRKYDPSFGQNINRVIFNVGSGLYYYTENFYAGFSVPNIIHQSIDNTSGSEKNQAVQFRHYYLSAGYVYKVSDVVDIKPSALLKIAEGAPVQLDISSNFWYNQKFCLGFSYRTQDSFTALMQVQLKQFRAGFAFDFITSSLSRYTTGNHEVMIRYDIKGKTPSGRNPRNF